TGTIDYLNVPSEPYLRFENALREGQKITADFDPMLAKLVVHGSDRGQAVERAIGALRDLSVLGVRTNIDYLAGILDHEAFRAGDLHTGFLAEHASALLPELSDRQVLEAAIIAGALGFRTFRDMAFGVPQPYASMNAWRN
ncbi:biotin carboxylase, partial [Bradyrhizobium genosp. SA-3]